MHPVYHRFIPMEDTGNGSHPRLDRRGTPAGFKGYYILFTGVFK